MKKIVSVLLSLVIIIGVFAGMNVTVSANQSVAYNGGFSTNYTLTGDKASDIVAVALVQEGKTGLQLGYSEGWCDNFVSDCAILAGCADVIPQGGDVANFLNNLISAGATEVSSPQKGDIVIFYSGSYATHAALMIDSVNCINGNFNGTNCYNSYVSTCSYSSVNNYNGWWCAFYRPKYIHIHTWDGGKVTTKPTCKKNGVKTYTCTVCGETKTEKTAKSSHNYKALSVTKKATLTKNGTLKTKCSVCGKKSTSVIYRPKTFKLSKSSFTYNGKVQKPTVIVKDTKGKVIDKKYYSLSYKNNKTVGKATVSIKFKGRYAGTKTLNFKIVPKGTVIKKLTAATKAYTIKWNKQSTQTTGYQIQYATDSKFKNSKKTITIANKKATTKKLTGLAGYKKYYVRIRTYKRVAGVNYCSAWSAVKAITTNQTPSRLTSAKAKELYKKAEKEASRWLFTDSGCYYMSEDYWDDNNIYNYEGDLIAIPVYHKSITSVSKLKKHLSNYFDKSVYDTIVSNAYRDINGRLYFVAPYGIGGPMGYELKSVSLVSQKDNTAKVRIKIDEIYPDESRKTYTKHLNLKFIGNKWVFTNTFYIVYVIAPMKWLK